METDKSEIGWGAVDDSLSSVSTITHVDVASGPSPSILRNICVTMLGSSESLCSFISSVP